MILCKLLLPSWGLICDYWDRMIPSIEKQEGNMIIIKAYRPIDPEERKGARIGFVDIEIRDDAHPERDKEENNLEVCCGKFGKWVQWKGIPDPMNEGKWRKSSRYLAEGVQSKFSKAVIQELEKFAPDL